MEFDNMPMLHPLQHLHLVVHHLLVALDILLEDDLDSALALRPVCLAHYAICTSPEGLSEPILVSGGWDLACEMIGACGQTNFLS
jgi:hypothetical protein